MSFKKGAGKKDSTLLPRRGKDLKFGKLTYTYTPIYYKNVLLFFTFELKLLNNSDSSQSTPLLHAEVRNSWSWLTLVLVTLFLIVFFKWYLNTFLFTTVNGFYFQIQKFGVEVLFNEAMGDLIGTPQLTHYLTYLLF